ncbi:hypothetical protein PENTCL1PPCAC_5251, partial [Pristionchus entomophagus]
LANLPPDVIRQIVRLGVEWIDDMRLISPLWNSLALAHLTARKNLPTINLIRFHANSTGSPIIVMCIAQRFRKYFGAENWESKTIPNDDDNIFVYSNFEFVIIASQIKVPSRIVRILDRCSKIEILELNLDISRQRPEICCIIAALRDVIIKQVTFSALSMDFNDSSASNILCVLRAHSFERLTLSTELPTFMFDLRDLFQAHGTFGTFYAEAASLV